MGGSYALDGVTSTTRKGRAMNRTVLAIDPGNVESAYVILGSDWLIKAHKKAGNEIILADIKNLLESRTEAITGLAIEMVASYGMAVGATVFDTCFWAGRFWEACKNIPHKELIYRKEEKLNLCGSVRAKDANIRQALIDRFAPNTLNSGKGTKKNPGYFYGFKADEWAAMAVAVTYADKFWSGVGSE